MSWPRQLPSRRKVSWQLKTLRDALANYLKGHGGREDDARVMANMKHLWEHLYVVQDRPRFLIVWNGEELRGSVDYRDTDNRVDRRFAVVAVRGQGFADPASGGKELPFVDVMEDVRDLVRSLTGISEEFPASYLGCKPLPNILPDKIQNAFADAYMAEFGTANDIPAIQDNVPTE